MIKQKYEEKNMSAITEAMLTYYNLFIRNMKLLVIKLVFLVKQ